MQQKLGNFATLEKQLAKRASLELEPQVVLLNEFSEAVLCCGTIRQLRELFHFQRDPRDFSRRDTLDFCCRNPAGANDPAVPVRAEVSQRRDVVTDRVFKGVAELQVSNFLVCVGRVQALKIRTGDKRERRSHFEFGLKDIRLIANQIRQPLMVIDEEH